MITHSVQESPEARASRLEVHFYDLHVRLIAANDLASERGRVLVETEARYIHMIEEAYGKLSQAYKSQAELEETCRVLTAENATLNKRVFEVKSTADLYLNQATSNGYNLKMALEKVDPLRDHNVALMSRLDSLHHHIWVRLGKFLGFFKEA